MTRKIICNIFSHFVIVSEFNVRISRQQSGIGDSRQTENRQPHFKNYKLQWKIKFRYCDYHQQQQQQLKRSK